MRVTAVTIDTHEKRSHPSEHGHFDSRVSYTAEIQLGEDPDRAVEFLQFKARQQVAVECDRWIAEIKTRKAQDNARRDLQWIVERIENRLPDDTDAEQFDKKLALLPDNEHPDWRAKLKAAQAEYLTRTKSDLDKIVEKASRRALSPRGVSDCQELTHRLPEDERQGYIDKMADAIAARDATEAAQIAQSNEIADSGVEFAIEFDDGPRDQEMPF